MGDHSIEIAEIEERYKSLIINTERYQKVKSIGKGGYAEVWLVKDKETGADIALKQLFSEISPKQIQNFAREVDTMADTNHPFLLKFYGFSPLTPLSILTEYIPNGSLFHFIRADPKGNFLNGTRKTLIAMGIASAMNFLHKRGIIHRDLKSMNILLDNELLPRICDFGIARFFSNSQEPITMHLGTPHWMAPESLYGKGYGFPVDVYGFAMVLYELLTFKIPWAGLDPLSVTRTVVIENKRPKIPQTAPKSLRNLIVKCWQTNANARPTFAEIYRLFSTGAVFFEGTDYESVKKLNLQLIEKGYEKSRIAKKESPNSNTTNQNNTPIKSESKRNTNTESVSSLGKNSLMADVSRNESIVINKENTYALNDSSDVASFKGHLPSLSESDSNTLTPVKILKPSKPHPRIPIVESFRDNNLETIFSESSEQSNKEDTKEKHPSYDELIVQNPSHPSFLVELKKLSQNNEANSILLFHQVIQPVINAEPYDQSCLIALKALKTSIVCQQSFDLYIQSRHFLKLPILKPGFFEVSLDILIIIFSRDPSVFQGDFNVQLTSIITQDPEKALILIQHAVKHFYLMVDPWSIIDHLIIDSEWFISCSSAPEYLSTLFYVCHNCAEYRNARIESIMDIFMSSLQLYDRRILTVSLNAIFLLSEQTPLIDGNIYSRLLLDDCLYENTIALLVKFPIENANSDLIDCLFECAQSNSSATVVLIGLAEDSSNSLLMIQSPWWLIECLPSRIDTVRILLMILTHMELRNQILNIPELYKMFSLISEDADVNLLLCASSIIRSLPLCKALVKNLHSSGSLRSIIHYAFELNSENAISSLLRLIHFLSSAVYISEFALLPRKLKSILKLKNNTSCLSLHVIVSLSQFKECANEFLAMGLEGYFRKLLSDPDYHDLALRFITNIEKYKTVL